MDKPYKDLTSTEMSLFNDSKWRDFHGYSTNEEVYNVLIGKRVAEGSRKSTVKSNLELSNLANDPEWKDFHHGHASDQEARQFLKA